MTLRSLRLKNTVHSDYHSHDVARIVSVMHAHGYYISPTDAYEAWVRRSDRMAAGWLGLPDDDQEIVQDILYECENPEGVDE